MSTIFASSGSTKRGVWGALKFFSASWVVTLAAYTVLFSLAIIASQEFPELQKRIPIPALKINPMTKPAQ